MNEIPKGPVVDWLRGLLDGLWEMVKQLIAEFVLGVHAVKTEVAHLTEQVGWLPWKLAAFLIVLVVVHAVITRPRKP